MIVLWPQEFAARMKKDVGEIRKILTERVLERILEKVNKNEINANDVKMIMQRVLNGEDIESMKTEKITEDELEKRISDIVKEKPGLRANAYMGLVIAKLGASVDKRKAMEILNRIVK
jgi:uncharacterized protein YqeY